MLLLSDVMPLPLWPLSCNGIWAVCLRIGRCRRQVLKGLRQHGAQGSTEEMMQPCPLCLHLISLVGQVLEGLRQHGVPFANNVRAARESALPSSVEFQSNLFINTIEHYELTAIWIDSIAEHSEATPQRSFDEHHSHVCGKAGGRGASVNRARAWCRSRVVRTLLGSQRRR